MTFPRPRWRIRGLMAVVAAYALAFAAFPPGAAIYLTIVLTGLAAPVPGPARWGRMARARGALWVAAAYPWFPLAALYATWTVAWATLGHRPLASLDDPKMLGGAVVIVANLAALLMFGAPVALIAAIVLTFVEIGLTVRAARPHREDELARLALGPFTSWFIGWLVFSGDAGGVLRWFLD